MLAPEDATSVVNRLRARLLTRSADVQKNEEYFRGKQPLTYASDKWREFNAKRFEGFSDNWCGVVGSAPAERIKLTGIRLGDDADVYSADERMLMEFWQRNEMDAQSSQGFLHSVIASTSAVTVWPGNDGPEATWERADQVIVDYEPGSRIRRYALKLWSEDDYEYATLYARDAIYKFERKSSDLVHFSSAGWERREIPDERWPLTHDFGSVPVVEVPNRPMLGADPLSDIAGTRAMQDAINLLWAYLFAAADFASMPARVVMGQEPPKIPILDDDGNIVGEKEVEPAELTQGRMLWLTGQNTSIGEWKSAQLDTFTDVIVRCAKHIAAQTRTPMHAFGELVNINGETLIATETGLVNKVEEFHLFASGAMREVFRLFALCEEKQELADSVRTSRILWADPATHSLAQASDAALKDRQVGFPFEWVAEKRYGMTPPEIARLVQLREVERTMEANTDALAAFGSPDAELATS